MGSPQPIRSTVRIGAVRILDKYGRTPALSLLAKSEYLDIPVFEYRLELAVRQAREHLSRWAQGRRR
jgi:hypothetical protein